MVDKISSFLCISAAKIGYEERILKHLPLGMASAYPRKLWNKQLKYSSGNFVVPVGESINASADLNCRPTRSKLFIRL